jgi:hypothetical protein
MNLPHVVAVYVETLFAAPERQVYVGDDLESPLYGLSVLELHHQLVPRRDGPYGRPFVRRGRTLSERSGWVCQEYKESKAECNRSAPHDTLL